jgi:hypothetical protein
MENGKKGVWKPKEEENLDWPNINQGTFYHREAATSSVAKVIGMADLVPETIERTYAKSGLGSKDKGAMMAFAKNAVEAWTLPDDERFDGDHDLARAAALDYLAGNTDRHAKNWMVQDGKKLVLIDNGLLWPHSSGGNFRSRLLDECKGRHGHILVPKEVKSWDAEKIAGALRQHKIEEDAITMMKARLVKLKTMVGHHFHRPEGV